MGLERGNAREFWEGPEATAPAAAEWAPGCEPARPAKSWLARVVRKPAVAGTAAAAALAAGAAALNTYLGRRAERRRPPRGKFVDVDGVRLHYVEAGSGRPLLLLHGNGSTVEDFVFSGMMEKCAVGCRVLAFDRPGFGHSTRPRGRAWTPEAQADLIADALGHLGVERAAVFGHSWGTLVALALALRHPQLVSCLLLASGYYFPVPRADVLFFSAPSVPVVGDVLCYTVSPLFSRATWKPVLNRVFSPNKIPENLSRYLRPLALRPWQLRAVSEDTAAMIPAAARLSPAYDGLRTPLTVIAGEEDKIVPPEQSKELHRHVVWSRLEIIPGAGHMVHHGATDQVVAAIQRAMARYV